MSKALLRKKYKEMRQSLSREEIRDRSFSIASLLADLLRSDGFCIHLFLPIQRFNEIDTYVIRNQIQSIFPNTSWVVSKSNFEDNSLAHFQFTPEIKIIESSFGIPEPLDGKVANPDELDYILVPLLAFDKKGHRLGYGKGFYDRFLSDCPTNVVKVGLSLFPPSEESLPIDPWDIPLDICITPEKIYSFPR